MNAVCEAAYSGDGDPMETDWVELLWADGTRSSPVPRITISGAPDLTEEEQALYRQLCIIASLVCDEAMDEETAARLYDLKSYAGYNWVIDHDGIGSFFQKRRRTAGRLSRL